MKKILTALAVSFIVIFMIYARAWPEEGEITNNNRPEEVQQWLIKDKQQENDEEQEDSQENQPQDDAEQEEIPQDEDNLAGTSQLAPGTTAPVWTHRGQLEDVTDNGKAMWAARFGWDETQFTLDVAMIRLPELEEGFFYEGWLVRQEPFKFISTWPTQQEWPGEQSNSRMTGNNYSAFTRYILTLEPDDGNPDPAEHILEGDLFPESE